MSGSGGVLSSAFGPSGALVCGNTEGDIAVWPTHKAQKAANSQSGYRIKGAHPGGPIYAISFPDEKGKPELLATGGDEEIRLWNLKAVIQGGNSSSSPSPHKPLCILRNPQKKGTRQFTSPVAETNGLVSTRDGTMYAASGDGNVYGWDLSTQKCVCTLSGHEDTVYCVTTAPASAGSSLLCSGSEDGTVRGWDVRTHKEAFVLNPLTGKEMVKNNHSGVSSKGGGGGGGGGGDTKRAAWIGCLASDLSGNWMASGGGDSFVALWHIGSRRVTCTMPTAGTPQAVMFYNDTVVSAGNESFVFHWSMSGEMIGKVGCKSKSVFSLAAANKTSSSSKQQFVATGLNSIDLYLTKSVASNSWTF
eukprot:jgi/Bigna1/74424/fgenesh1_pg.29_\